MGPKIPYPVMSMFCVIPRPVNMMDLALVIMFCYLAKLTYNMEIIQVGLTESQHPFVNREFSSL